MASLVVRGREAIPTPAASTALATPRERLDYVDANDGLIDSIDRDPGQTS
jgi:hypothetical protein